MKNQTLKSCVLLAAIVVSFMFIRWNTIGQEKESKTSKINTLTKAEMKEGWKLLFDGKSFNGWRCLGRDHIPNDQWTIEDGLIRKVFTGDGKKLPDGRPNEGGDLVTTETFGNFELSFEWKIIKAGNSGIKYNVSEEILQKYGSKFAALGFEYQLLDDGNDAYKGKLKPSQFSGSLYDLLPAKNIILKPIGEFNISRILVDGNHVEHWLNGIKVLEFEFGSKELDEAYKVSKFNEIPSFQKKHKTPIVLQNHYKESWFRNIKIRNI